MLKSLVIEIHQSMTADSAQSENVASVARSFFRGAGEGGCVVSLFLETRVGSGSLVPRPEEEETTRLKVNLVSTNVFTELCVGGYNVGYVIFLDEMLE